MLHIHPIAKQFVPISNMRRAALARDISAYGQRVPIVLLDGMIWDGRARYEICIETGRAPWLVPLRGKGPLEFYIYANISRTGEPSSPERQVLIDRLGNVFSNTHNAEMILRRSVWLRSARAEFDRLERTAPANCSVCTQHRDFAHAHHLFPLALQYECGVDEAIHDHAWLCPVHHKKVHILLSGYLTGTRDLSFLDSIPDEYATEWLAIEKIAQSGIDLCTAALGKDDFDRKGRFDPPFGMYVASHQHEMDLWRGPA